MTDRFSSYLYLALLFTLFGVVSFLVVMTRRHPFWVSKKLKLGALIITLTGITAGCPTTTCYAQPYEPPFRIDQAQHDHNITLPSSASDTITGYIVGQTHGSFAIFDSTESLVTSGDIAAKDGTLDEREEAFNIILDAPLEPATYYLRLYTFPADSIEDFNQYEQSYTLIVTE